MALPQAFDGSNGLRRLHQWEEMTHILQHDVGSQEAGGREVPSQGFTHCWVRMVVVQRSDDNHAGQPQAW
eukprot:CAMPEP_0203918616 /NCGR_PEP_ID=MMETSP0359-20131031/59118_1 /ASSEMBLY_ACC=CAM_ASM_000338 /TAXON_ID=268821 /ORGANISM="Scrippsiella Hangoei, Strain SHTV-5" /LENGTH=69 /DNA_ID=CAMNT_0050845745 /DNA_START=469 /DNA_END=675 /DNA_ORIENTATION=-